MLNALQKKILHHTVSLALPLSRAGQFETGTSALDDVARLRDSDEKRLIDFLSRGYDSDVRPVFNASHAVVIQLGITLTQIFDMVSGGVTALLMGRSMETTYR